jgi:putative ATP-dependent endonuclease of the OLD family
LPPIEAWPRKREGDLLIKEISIKNYRSIEMATLSNCGNFNVLIGKNNSGKSNILAGIEALFSCLRRNEFVDLRPPLGKQIDFNVNHTNDPIELRVCFTLSNSDWATLVTDIISDLPQVKNIIDAITQTPDLVACMKIHTKGYAWLERFELIEKPYTFASGEINIL